MNRPIVKKCFFGIVLSALLALSTAWGAPNPAFVHSGDGVLLIGRAPGQILRIQFRNGADQYPSTGITAIHRLFGIPAGNTADHIELRLLEWLDHLQEHFGNAPIILRSGFRSRTSNNTLRARGKLAAQSSMHIEGGAIDCHLPGHASSVVADYARSLNYGGVGYYHGGEIHLDGGPARHWDEKTSKTESNEPQRNAVISASTEFDRYNPNATVRLRLMRITEYPVGVSATVELVCAEKPDIVQKRVGLSTPPSPAAPRRPLPIGERNGEGPCIFLPDFLAARSGTFTMPDQSPCGSGAIQARIRFCSRNSEQMPEAILSNPFWTR